MRRASPQTRSSRWRVLSIVGRVVPYAIAGLVGALGSAVLGSFVGATGYALFPTQNGGDFWCGRRVDGPAYAVHSVMTAGPPLHKVRLPQHPPPSTLAPPPWAFVPPFRPWWMQEFIGAGLPVKCLTATRVWTYGALAGAWSASWPARGMQIGAPVAHPLAAGRGLVVPVTPVWRGLLVDTAFYAAVVFALVRVWRALSRVLWPMPDFAALAPPNAAAPAEPA